MANNPGLSTVLVVTIFAIMVLSPFAPTTSASSEEYEDPIAFIQSDWNVTLSGLGSNYISYSNYQYHDSHLNGQSDDDERFGHDDKNFTSPLLSYGC